MTQDEMKEHDELFRAEAEQSRERKASGGDKPAKAKRSRRNKDVALSHGEMALIRVYRGVNEWLDGGTVEQQRAVREWLGTGDNLDQTYRLLTAIFGEFDKAIQRSPRAEIAATVSHRDADAQGGVQ